MKARINQLNSLNAKYSLGLRLYHKIEKVLKFDHSKSENFELEFLNEVPQKLKVELCFCMYRSYIERLPFFQERNGHFIAFVCPMLVQQFVPQKEIIYREGDPVNEIYFLLKGKVGMVLNSYAIDHVFMYIEEGHYFGEIDMFNQTSINSKKRTSKDKKRKFTTVAMENCELVVWSKKNIYIADKEFDDVIKAIFMTAKKRLKKALAAKHAAKEYYENLMNKAEETVFQPIVTRAGSNDSNNIFEHKKQNYNEEDNDTIMEENENENDDEENGSKTFERLNPTPAHDPMESNEEIKFSKPKRVSSNINNFTSPMNKVLSKSHTNFTPLQKRMTGMGGETPKTPMDNNQLFKLGMDAGGSQEK